MSLKRSTLNPALLHPSPKAQKYPHHWSYISVKCQLLYIASHNFYYQIRNVITDSRAAFFQLAVV